MAYSDVILTLGLLLGCSEAYLSSLCCGDNFCCSIATGGSATCWGGNKFSPPSTTVKAITCGGKAMLAVDASMKIAYYEGDSGYGPDSAGASSLVGVEVKDVDLSFWGGALIKTDGSIQTWSQDPVYCTSSTSISCQPTSVNPSQVAFGFQNVPSTAAYTAISCGGKRGGHFCCVIPSTGTGVECFGDSRGTYTPTVAQLSGINFAVHQMSAGVDFIVVLSAAGKLGVYGHVTNGEITKATSGINNKRPTSIGSLPQNSLDTGSEVYVQVSSCNFGVYALKQDGTLHAWGRIMTSCSVCGADVPVDFAGYPDGVTWGQLSGGNVGGYAHYCALSSTNVVTCWGSDYAGQVSREKPSAAMKADFVYPSVLGSSSSPSPVPTPAPAPVTITGTIYCDNDFEFYFNGQLVKSDPIDFTPHQAVRVSFTYDGTSAKTYAILCQDYASASGYEYTSTNNPQLGDGALIAEFSDGTVTSSNWKSYVATHGPTAASESAGCTASNLGACVVEDYGTPANWYSTSFDDSSWTASTQYTVQQAGWGRTPTWSSSSGCCQPTSPMTRSNLGCCNCNSDGTASGYTSVTVTESECLDPSAELGSSSASFIWGASLTKDNKMLFRYTVAAPSSSSTPTPSPTPTASSSSSSSSSYLKVTSGSCADAGGAPITTVEACNTAAAALGLSDTVAQESGATPRPEGCFVHTGGNLYLATNAANAGAGATSDHHPICAMSASQSPSPSPTSSGSSPSPVPAPVPTPSVQPNIYLSDPIDTVDSIHSAYCFDIFGMPGSNTCDNKAIEARSCRAAGEDTQFEYDAASSAIKATNYNSYCSGGLGPCLTVDGSIAAGASLLMAACTGDAKQAFTYSATTCRFMLGGFCLQVGATSNMQTGLKRTVSLVDCASVEAARSEWTVVPTSGSWTTCVPAATPTPSATPVPTPTPAAPGATPTPGAASVPTPTPAAPAATPTPGAAPVPTPIPSPSPTPVLAPTPAAPGANPTPSPTTSGPTPASAADFASHTLGEALTLLLAMTMCRLVVNVV